jgi:oligosaccharide translocation protein RFT1
VCTFLLWGTKPYDRLNGVTEAFLQAVGEASTLRSQTYFLFLCWMVFGASSYVLLKVMNLGSAGLVVANIFNLFLRILFSTRFISSFFSANISKDEKKFTLLSAWVGNSYVWAAFGCSWLVTNYFDYGLGNWRKQAIHVGVGGVCFLVTVLLLYRSERFKLLPRISQYYKLLRS